jgi:hypothetical protein
LSERARHFDGPEHADHPVEPTAPGDRVNVRTEDNRRKILPLARATSDQVPDRVDLGQQPGIGHPLREPRPRSRVLRCERPARPARLIRGAEGAESLPVSVKTLLVDREPGVGAVGYTLHRPEDTE